jgi:rSAM/selenodomain-associated transferase 1
MQICVIAKEPRPGFAKTRLTPPCTPEQAAAIAEASLADTLEVVLRTQARRRVLVLDGEIGAWLPPGFEIVAQTGGGLDQRLAAAFAYCFSTMPDEHVVLVGMDTPQVQPDQLMAADRHLRTGADAVLGPATDGGYWLIGLREHVPRAFTDVPMSTPWTGNAQRTTLERLGCSLAFVDELDDVDSFSDAQRVAAGFPYGRFASAVARVIRRPAEAIS